MDKYIKINGILIPTPDGYEWKISDLDLEGKRNNAGGLIRRRIRENVHSLDFDWTYVDKDKFHAFIKEMKKLPPEFDLTFMDATGELLTKRMYRADVTASAFLYDANSVQWKNCKTSFIEI